MLKRKGKIVDDLIQKLMNWRHSGVNVYGGNALPEMTRPVRKLWVNISCATPLPTCLSADRGKDHLHRGHGAGVVSFRHDLRQEQEEL
jgi:hypothetical protein